jgi:hypothetical protein
LTFASASSAGGIHEVKDAKGAIEEDTESFSSRAWSHEGSPERAFKLKSEKNWRKMKKFSPRAS